MTSTTLTSIAALVVFGSILVPFGAFFIMNKINSNPKVNLIINLSSLD
jgi:hypothetical protein